MNKRRTRVSAKDGPPLLSEFVALYFCVAAIVEIL